MFKLISSALVIVAAVSFVGCSRVTVEPGQEVVLVSKPLLFGDGGVLPKPLTQGSEYVAISTDGVPFVVTPVSYEEHFDDMMTDDNTPIDFSAYINIQLLSGQTPELYNKFGKNWYKNNVAVEFRKLVRDKASQHKMFTLTSNREILTQLEKEIYDQITAFIKHKGLPVQVNSVTIGAVTPPAKVLEETERTAAQNQSALTQSARAAAELARKQAEHNKALADNEYRESMGMTMTEYLHLRNLEIQKEKIDMVRGKNNVSVILGDAVPTIDAQK